MWLCYEVKKERDSRVEKLPLIVPPSPWHFPDLFGLIYPLPQYSMAHLAEEVRAKDTEPENLVGSLKLLLNMGPRGADCAS